MAQKNGDESWNEEIERLDVEIERFTARKHDCEQELRRLLMEEDPGQGRTFAAEIHALRQERLKLDVEIEMRRRKKNRILLAREDQGESPPFRAS